MDTLLPLASVGDGQSPVVTGKVTEGSVNLGRANP
jgi:hypothetical protein